MGSRFLITGVQLGMLKAGLETKQYNIISETLKTIEDNQCVGSSSTDIKDDCKTWRPTPVGQLRFGV